MNVNKLVSYLTSCWHMAQHPHLADALMYGHGKVLMLSLVWSIPKRHLQSKPFVGLVILFVDGHQMWSLLSSFEGWWQRFCSYTRTRFCYEPRNKYSKMFSWWIFNPSILYFLLQHFFISYLGHASYRMMWFPKV